MIDKLREVPTLPARPYLGKLIERLDASHSGVFENSSQLHLTVLNLLRLRISSHRLTRRLFHVPVVGCDGN